MHTLLLSNEIKQDLPWLAGSRDRDTDPRETFVADLTRGKREARREELGGYIGGEGGRQCDGFGSRRRMPSLGRGRPRRRRRWGGRPSDTFGQFRSQFELCAAESERADAVVEILEVD